MVQTKKFQNTFINEYLAINLHERDLRKRATEQGLQQGLQQGKVEAYIDLIKSNLLSVKDASVKLGMPESEILKMLAGD